MIKKKIRQMGSMYIKITRTGTESVCVRVCSCVYINHDSQKGRVENTSFQTSHTKREDSSTVKLCCSWTGKVVHTYRKNLFPSQKNCVCVLLKKSKKNMFDEYID